MTVAVVVDHEPSWAGRAQELLDEVAAAFARLEDSDRFEYDHIGSTAEAPLP